MNPAIRAFLRSVGTSYQTPKREHIVQALAVVRDLDPNVLREWIDSADLPSVMNALALDDVDSDASPRRAWERLASEQIIPFEWVEDDRFVIDSEHSAVLLAADARSIQTAQALLEECFCGLSAWECTPPQTLRWRTTFRQQWQEEEYGFLVSRFGPTMLLFGEKQEGWFPLFRTAAQLLHEEKVPPNDDDAFYDEFYFSDDGVSALVRHAVCWLRYQELVADVAEAPALKKLWPAMPDLFAPLLSVWALGLQPSHTSRDEDTLIVSLPAL